MHVSIKFLSLYSYLYATMLSQFYWLVIGDILCIKNKVSTARMNIFNWKKLSAYLTVFAIRLN